MVRKMAEWLVPLLLGALLLNGVMYLQQPRMIFFPWPTLESTPTDWGLAYDDVTLETDDGVALHGWYIPYPAARRTVLFLHGNAGNISHRRESIEIFHRLGSNVLIIDYRGYGQSAGSPSETGLYLDAAAAWRHLTVDRGADPADVIIFGRSLRWCGRGPPGIPGNRRRGHLRIHLQLGARLCPPGVSPAVAPGRLALSVRRRQRAGARLCTGDDSAQFRRRDHALRAGPPAV